MRLTRGKRLRDPSRTFTVDERWKKKPLTLEGNSRGGNNGGGNPQEKAPSKNKGIQNTDNGATRKNGLQV